MWVHLGFDEAQLFPKDDIIVKVWELLSLADEDLQPK